MEETLVDTSSFQTTKSRQKTTLPTLFCFLGPLSTLIMRNGRSSCLCQRQDAHFSSFLSRRSRSGKSLLWCAINRINTANNRDTHTLFHFSSLFSILMVWSVKKKNHTLMTEKGDVKNRTQYHPVRENGGTIANLELNNW